MAREPVRWGKYREIEQARNVETERGKERARSNSRISRLVRYARPIEGRCFREGSSLLFTALFIYTLPPPSTLPMALPPPSSPTTTLCQTVEQIQSKPVVLNREYPSPFYSVETKIVTIVFQSLYKFNYLLMTLYSCCGEERGRYWD